MSLSSVRGYVAVPIVSVLIRLKPTLADAQGAVMKKALNNLGYDDVKDVRVGKLIELEVDDNGTGQNCDHEVEKMCESLLANPVIEDFEIRIGPLSE